MNKNRKDTRTPMQIIFDIKSCLNKAYRETVTIYGFEASFGHYQVKGEEIRLRDENGLYTLLVTSITSESWSVIDEITNKESIIKREKAGNEN